MTEADFPHLVIGACMNVHRALGPGLAPEAYRECLAIELRELEFDFARHVPLEFDYRARRVQGGMFLDFVIGGSLLLMVRSQEAVSKLEQQQLEALVRIGRFRTGLLVNFNVSVLRKGIHQVTRKRRPREQ